MASADASAAPAPRHAWIIAPQRDLLLFVGTPLLIVPLIALAQQGLSVEQIALYVAAFGATGHHLPGLLRAYGDRELFERFRTRFIVAPIVLFSVALLFRYANFHALISMATLWGAYHGLAQVYGIGRIYDAKMGLISPRTARLDRALCFAWFGGGLWFSEGRLGGIVDELYLCGVPEIPALWVSAFRGIWAVGMALVSVAFVVNYRLQRARGETQNTVKLLLLASSIGFWWYAMVGLSNPVIGIAAFEIFHDVQYLGIVWVFNRSRVEKGRGVGSFTRALFQPKRAHVLVYVGMVFAYGSIVLVSHALHGHEIQRTLLAFILASGFLHFYYDAFIWNLSDRSTREDLDVKARRPIGPKAILPSRLPANWRWGLFALPVLLLTFSELRGVPTALERHREVIASVPGSTRAHLKLGDALRDEGRLDEALAHYLRATVQRPDDVGPQRKLGDTYRRLGAWPLAAQAYAEVARLEPEDASAHYNLGIARQAGGDLEGAARAYARAVEADPLAVDALGNLGIVRREQGRLEDARGAFERAVAAAPNHAPSHHNLGVLELQAGNRARAAAHFETVLRLDPEHRKAALALRQLRATPSR